MCGELTEAPVRVTVAAKFPVGELSSIISHPGFMKANMRPSSVSHADIYEARRRNQFRPTSPAPDSVLT